VARGRQAYVITPLVEESEKVEVKAAEAEASRLATEIFPELNVGMIHGRMRPPAKQKVMDEFRRGRVDVLISTTVVEVGVDVPNASVMLIEDADRFGLSQLHQLRGRIGRGAHKSTCLLLTSFPSDDGDEATDAHRRLEVMASTTDGFELATKDLELRGTGTILGDRQSGFSDLRLTHLVRDIEILKAAREEAFRLIAQDPDLSRHPHIRLEMEGRFADRLDWLFRS
ncbi:MAG: helicase-related protein, partial [Actinomycetota bacterium]